MKKMFDSVAVHCLVYKKTYIDYRCIALSLTGINIISGLKEVHIAASVNFKDVPYSIIKNKKSHNCTSLSPNY